VSERAENVIRADAVVAKNFELVDKDGDSRAKITTTTDKDVGLNFYDVQGNPRIVFAIQEEGNATISLIDHERKERIRVSSGAMGNAITIYDREERTRLLLQLDPEADGPEIHMVDESGSPEVVLTQVGRDRANPSPLILVREPDGLYREL
jgi:hypothetical protein